jgi:hypothetical protein
LFDSYSENNNQAEDLFIGDPAGVVDDDAQPVDFAYTPEDEHDDNLHHKFNSIDADELGPIEAHDFVLDLIDYGNNGSNEEYELAMTEDEERDDLFFIRTLAQNEEILQATLIAEEEIASAPLHVQLNGQGHCLIRKNAKLRMLRQHKSFFQRIVARCKGRTIPLVYAEGALFPDIFFFSTDTGAILGATNSSLD